MKTIVYLPTDKLDLSKQKFSIQENNAKVSDSQFTKIIFPFSLPISEEILKSPVIVSQSGTKLLL